VQGKVVSSGERLLTIVDTRSVWAVLDVPEEAAARLRPDAAIVFTTHGLRGEQLPGRVTWIATELDRRTRTLKAHAALENQDGRLKAGAFGAAEVTLGDRRDALLVPLDAVQWEGCCNVVFVPAGERAFLPRKVTLGGATGTHVEVLRGLEAGEVVVSVGAFLLKTELLKGSIGAGCCEAD
jgi:cobalt-zinc-cadmium efflux system membrane fusion protein